jgi:hypothetical protein
VVPPVSFSLYKARSMEEHRLTRSIRLTVSKKRLAVVGVRTVEAFPKVIDLLVDLDHST